jgi:hypothetical protein
MCHSDRCVFPSEAFDITPRLFIVYMDLQLRFAYQHTETIAFDILSKAGWRSSIIRALFVQALLQYVFADV